MEQLLGIDRRPGDGMVTVPFGVTLAGAVVGLLLGPLLIQGRLAGLVGVFVCTFVASSVWSTRRWHPSVTPVLATGCSPIETGVAPAAGADDTRAMDVSNWIEHRRRDGELIGWMRLEGDAFVPVDLLGRDRAEPCTWDVAEALLDEIGLRYLADPLELRHDGASPRRVRIVELDRHRVRVKDEDWGAIDAPVEHHQLAWPPGDALVEWADGHGSPGW